MSSSSTCESDAPEVITFKKLQDNGEDEIKYVYHLSDIHIRNNQRHEEYNKVFARTYRKLISMIGNHTRSSVIFVTGDVVHAKTEMSPELFSILCLFFGSLTKIAPVIVIPGNHDCNLSNRSRMDALTPVVDAIKLENLFYLKNTGVYQYQNILLGVTGIFDNALIKADKIDKSIWKKMKYDNKYKIALYHGPVHGAKTDVGYRMNNTELVADDFDGYDYVMLGDIHMHQYMNKRRTIAYAGSLIQQSYGESLDNHGFMRWDLRDGESELVKIRNDYGFCTVNIIDGKMVDTYIPPNPCIRFNLENTDQIQYQEIFAELEKKYNIRGVAEQKPFKTSATLHDSPSEKRKSISSCKTQEEIIQQYLKNKIKDAEQIANIVDLHQKIYQKILEEKKDQVFDVMHNSTKKQKWNIMVLTFENMISYGKDNIIDFQKFESNQIIGITAPNHYGKSAILDIILFCLFDRCSRGDRRDILNKNKDDMYCSLLFRIGCQKYLIERIGKRRGLSVKIDVNFYSISEDKRGDEVRESLNGVNPCETNKKITDLIGDYDDYLLTCFCLQNGQSKKGSNFIDMTHLQKKEYLQDILKLNVFEDCHNVAKDTLKKMSGHMEVMEQLNLTSGSLKDMKAEALALTEEIKTLQITKAHKERLRIFIDDAADTYKNNIKTEIDELSHYNLRSEDDILRAIEEMKDKIKNFDCNAFDVVDVKNKIASQRNEIIAVDRDAENIQRALNEKQQETVKVTRQIINIPTSHYNTDIQDAITEKDRCNTRMNEICDKMLTFLDFDAIKEKNEEMLRIEREINLLRRTINHMCYHEYDLASLLEKECKLNDRIEELVKESFSVRYIGSDKRSKILFEMRLRKKFRKLIRINADSVVDEKVQALNMEWLEQDAAWMSKNQKLLEKKKSNYDLICQLRNELICVQHSIWEAQIAECDKVNNDIIQKKIDALEGDVMYLKKFADYKRDIEALDVENELLMEKSKLLTEKITKYEDNVRHDKTNKQHNENIKNLRVEIDNFNSQRSELLCKKKTVVQEISANELAIQKNEKMNKAYDDAKNHLRLIKKYHLSFIYWKVADEQRKIFEKNKQEYDAEMNKISGDLESKEKMLTECKERIEKYMVFRKKYDDKSVEINLYQLYVQIMNYNGLPYEMLKAYLPLIEADTNQILHSMVDFSIEFMFYDAALVEEQKGNNMKSTMGSVNINICYQDMKPYSATLSSGFERFIIGLAIRMTLGSISLTAKPNFLIIDEGWSCLDSENLNNVGSIMNYIKSQYEHVIIISHLDELKNQTDYPIIIDRHRGYSKVNNDVIGSKKTKKKITYK